MLMQKKHIIILFIILTVFVSSMFFVSANLIYGKVFPNFKISNVNISSMTTDEAIQSLSQHFSVPESIKLITKNEKFDLNLKEIDLEYDIEGTVLNAYTLYRNGNIFTYTKGFISSLLSPHEIEISYSYSNDKLQSLISAIAAQVEDDPISPSALIENNEVIINPGDKGTQIDKIKLSSDIENAIKNASFQPIPIQINEVDPTLNDEQIDMFRLLAKELSEKTIVLKIEDENIDLKINDILKLIYYEGNPQENELNKFINTFSQNHNKNPQNSIFEYKDGRVEEFIPSKNGVMVRGSELFDKLSSEIVKLSDSPHDLIEIDVPYDTIPPEITNDQVNNLGINELIGKGSSTFWGSISSRIHNIGVASNKFNGTLVKPDETISFNDVLGDVSAATGYQKAYVIKDGQTILGDGGGVCQVSTTLFRAALDAGLPIVERRAHAYRVSYYEQGYPPGLDATVYSPTTDLKIKNDTPGHLLIQTIYDPYNVSLDFEIYGTDDGRISAITDPVITSTTPPPEDLYIDDPTLPQGEVKQIDWKAWGAKVYFDYSVERDGEIIFEKTFYSNFQPWQAKFLRGTFPVN